MTKLSFELKMGPHLASLLKIPQNTPGFLSITNSYNLLKLMSIESVMPFSHLILCHPLLLLPSVFPSIRVRVRSSHQMTRVLEFQL